MTTSEKLSVREGLIKVVSAERFSFAPMSGSNTHVVIMEKHKDSLRHYTTLRSDRDRLSLGEQIWGNFICYVVDLSAREHRIQGNYPTSDRIHHLQVSADISYQAIDGEQVAIGVDDALRTLHDELETSLKRNLLRRPMTDVTEEYLEDLLFREGTRFQNWLGLRILKTRVSVTWDEAVLRARKEDYERRSKEKREDEARKRQWSLEDEQRRRNERLDKEDVAHIDEIVNQLGLEALPMDMRLRLHALPREQAIQEVIKFIEEQRTQFTNLNVQRLNQEYELLNKMIDKGVLEEMDMVDFGRQLLDRYQDMRGMHNMGLSPSFLFGSSSQKAIGSGKRKRDELEDTDPDSDE